MSLLGGLSNAIVGLSNSNYNNVSNSNGSGNESAQDNDVTADAETASTAPVDTPTPSESATVADAEDPQAAPAADNGLMPNRSEAATAETATPIYTPDAPREQAVNAADFARRLALAVQSKLTLSSLISELEGIDKAELTPLKAQTVDADGAYARADAAERRGDPATRSA